MDVEEKLNWIDEKYLKDFDYAPVDSEIKLQEAFTSPVEIKEEYSISEGEDIKDNTYLSYNMVLNLSLDTQTSMAMQVIEYALLSAPGAPLKQALIDAGIGKDILSFMTRTHTRLHFQLLLRIVKNLEKMNSTNYQ